MKFSIVTVTYNCRNTISYTIESVLAQTLSDFEYILIDGKSDDGTVDIIKKYKRKDKRIIYVSEPDDGIYDAMNKGISRACGDFIGILNSDDAYLPDTLENVTGHIEHSCKYQIIYGMTMVMNKDRIQEVMLRSHEFLNLSTICHQSVFVSKKVYDDFGVYDTSFKYVADYDFLVRMERNKKIKFSPVYEILVKYRGGGVSASKEANIEYLRFMKNNGFIPVKSYFLQRMKIGILGV